VREFLELDRLVIYKFEESQEMRLIALVETRLIASLQEHNWQQYTGCIVCEERATNDIPSVLNYQEKNCLMPSFKGW
jgi:two-component system, sensor histidine kinase and response regulator